MCQLDFASVSLNLVVLWSWTKGLWGLCCRERGGDVGVEVPRSQKGVREVARVKGNLKKSIAG